MYTEKLYGLRNLHLFNWDEWRRNQNIGNRHWFESVSITINKLPRFILIISWDPMNENQIASEQMVKVQSKLQTHLKSINFHHKTIALFSSNEPNRSNWINSTINFFGCVISSGRILIIENTWHAQASCPSIYHFWLILSHTRGLKAIIHRILEAL